MNSLINLINAFALISANDWLQIALYLGVLFALVVPLGAYMAAVYEGQQTFLSPILLPVEKLFYQISNIKPEKEMGWRHYAANLLSFSFFGTVLLYLILLFQDYLPLNPQGFAGLSPDLAFNTAVSFVTNTNWQSYSGESVMSYFSQMAGLTVQNFVSAAVGMAVLVALIRSLRRKNTATIGNFWADMLRGNLYILLPLSLIWTLGLASQGIVQTFGAYIDAPLMETQHVDEQKDTQGNITQKAETVTKQTIAVGPVAAQIAIKQLGTNGGGFFNTNSAHPFENPTPFSNFLEMLAILLIPAALCHTFGKMVGDVRQGFTVLATMTLIFVPLMLVCVMEEHKANPKFAPLMIDQTQTASQPGGNMEGKELRFGITNSALWASATTAASNGSVNAMHESFMPLGGMVPMLFMKFGEVVYGGVGTGLYGMLIFVIVAVFIAGLMVGRTPEYLGKKIQAFEMKMASICILVPCALVLIGTAVAVVMPDGITGIASPGAQGFSEVLYAMASAANNNGSAFAGLSANTPFYNTLLGLMMLMGRFWIILPTLAIAGSLAAKNTVPVSAGTLPTHTSLFVVVLASIIILVGVLTFVPALALGPVAEHFYLIKG